MLSKIIVKLVLPMLLVFGFSACSGGGGETSSTQTIKNLKVGDSVVVRPGDTVTPLTDDTEISVEHIINTENKVLTVIKGGVEFISGNYEIE